MPQTANYSAMHKSHKNDFDLRVANARRCLEILCRHIPFSSMIDHGCGIGPWLQAARKMGVENVKGLEGDWIRESSGNLDPAIEIFDLMTNTYQGDRYELAISIEVGEHLPKEASDRFCDGLTNSANIILFSAAIPKQGGVGHVNEQFIDYWVTKFWSRQFVPLDLIRPHIQSTPGMHRWLKQNLIVLVRYSELSLRPELHRFIAPLDSFSRIHPSMYAEKVKQAQKIYES